MNSIGWQEAVDYVRKYVVRISTPTGSGTGFLVARSSSANIIGIATAAHVVDDSFYWEYPIRIEHLDSGKERLLRVNERAILLDGQRDTAAVVFTDTTLPFPEELLELIDQNKHTRVGVE